MSFHEKARIIYKYIMHAYYCVPDFNLNPKAYNYSKSLIMANISTLVRLNMFWFMMKHNSKCYYECSYCCTDKSSKCHRPYRYRINQGSS